ncbi:histidine kinase [Leucobacter salsicius]|uniref:histidine kinase n=1 Tax=Leucobacter salsicius TaxID=664638 RepID=UPI00037F7003|nr:histidine kinase [Leucobacter salsicius]
MTSSVDHQPTVPLLAEPVAAQPTVPLPGVQQPQYAPEQAPQSPLPQSQPQTSQHPAGPAPKPAKRRGAPFRIVLTILQLAGVGIVGLATLGMLLGMLGAGIGLTFLLGVGLVVLVGLVYAVYGLAWFETQRVSGLYDLGVPALPLQKQHGRGFKAWLKSLGRQTIDGRMWRAVASFVVTSLLGMAVLGLAQGFIRSTATIFSGINVWWQPGIIGVLLCAAGIVGIALLHRIVTVAIIGSGAAEEQLEAQVLVTSQQREGAVRAADLERTRIERDLHDGVQPRLVSVAMTLGLAQQKIDSDPEAAKELVAEAHTSTKAAITELRQLARGIYASVLDDRGLDAALSALAARSHIPVQLDVRVTDRCSRTAEAAIYFAIAESLTNAAKHSRASECRVVVRVRDENMLWARVEDNGIGNARVVPGGGLDGIMNRVLAAGGTTRLDSPQGGPTTLEVSIPCAS